MQKSCKAWITRSFPISVNRKIINKHEGGSGRDYSAFEQVTADLQDLMDFIRQGFAYSAAYDGARARANFKQADIVSIDVDEGLTLEAALADEFVKTYASFMYTTRSHTNALPRFRVVFLLETPITDANTYSKLVRSIARKLGGDHAATDPARMFYGNNAARFLRLDHGLPETVAQELIDEEEDADNWSGSATSSATMTSSDYFDDGLTVRCADGKIRDFSEIVDKTKIHCPFHDDKTPSAYVLGNGAAKLIYCHSCSTTFRTRKSKYNFDLLTDEVTRVQSSDERILKLDDVEILREDLVVLKTQFLPKHMPIDDLTFIKSRKGTGKTHFVGQVISNLPKSNRIITIGHRVTLVKALSDRLGLNFYRDFKGKQPKSVTDKYATTLDSLHKVNPSVDYDLVVLDEIVQILGHFASETMGEKRNANRIALREIVGRAKRILALDADLSAAAVSTIGSWAESRQPRRKKLVLNEFRDAVPSTLHMYRLKGQLASELVADLAAGKRCYVASNSLKLVNSLAEHLETIIPRERILSVTADTISTAEDPSVKFILNPVSEAKRYAAVLSTPAIASGVDLTFPDDEIYFDSVFGFFESGVTDHFEIDQQLARVRHPRETKVYISARQNFLETNEDVIRDDLRDDVMFSYLRRGFGEPEAVAVDPMLELLIPITARRRASINRLRENFLEYKRKLGSTVVLVDDDKIAAQRGNALLRQGAVDNAQRKANALLSCRVLTLAEVEHLRRKDQTGQKLTEVEKVQLNRALMEDFYRRKLSHLVVEVDAGGKLREKILLLEDVLRETWRPYVGWPLERRTTNSPRNGVKLVKTDREKAALIREALTAARVLEGGRLDGQVEISKESLAGFVGFMKRRVTTGSLNAQFELAIRKDIDKSPAKQLGDLLALVNLKLTKARKISSGDKTRYVQYLEPGKLYAMERIMRVREEVPANFPEA